eukprot:CAMPEP_0204574392 /NCGR_PEP_ID=MMETSP0661-20131031/40579_1 /ASSEMBLY_ACC=CAM_ASM_000606 /TAXON_ID=109239 /ORGANISM="Alexandrium margalefi, Strain AMGDE01CS-322" /LENGTH=50 /DNA_ID=CAMNT_0051582915 /DNA_START=219 /DNA_END=368 /DNA_ORIENTATION=+
MTSPRNCTQVVMVALWSSSVLAAQASASSTTWKFCCMASRALASQQQLVA